MRLYYWKIISLMGENREQDEDRVRFYKFQWFLKFVLSLVSQTKSTSLPRAETSPRPNIACIYSQKWGLSSTAGLI